MNYFLFALRNLKRKGIRSWLTLLGICIGIAAVVSLISLGTGLQAAVLSQFGVSSTEVVTVQASGGFGIPGYGVVTPLTTDDVRAIDGLGSVDYSYAVNIGTISVDYNDKLVFTAAASIPKDYYKEYYEIADLEREDGRMLKSGDSKKILIGNSLSDGDTNGFGKDIIPGKTLIINGKSFSVAGVLKKKGSFTTDGSIFMFDYDFEDLFNKGENVSIITVKVKNKDLINKTKEDVERLMRQRRDADVGSEDFTVSTPETALSQINQVLGGIQAFVIIIASISIVIGTVGIVNTMTTSVLERRKEIGIMKSVGGKNSQIFAQFFIESGFLGLIGGGIGVVLGILLGYVGTISINNFIGADTQPQISLSLVLSSLIGSFLIGALAGIFPAMKAAKQNPVQALSS